MQEHLEPGLESGRHAHELARAGQPGHRRQHAADAFERVLSTIGEAADPVHFPPRLLAQAP